MIDNIDNIKTFKIYCVWIQKNCQMQKNSKNKNRSYVQVKIKMSV